MSSKHIGDLLNLSNNAELSTALKRSAAIGQLTMQLAERLPADMGAAILAAAIGDDGVLTVKTTSSAWASRLRFESAALIDAATAAGHKVRDVKVRVGRSNQA
jgi:hypothetical protein